MLINKDCAELVDKLPLADKMVWRAVLRPKPLYRYDWALGAWHGVLRWNSILHRGDRPRLSEVYYMRGYGKVPKEDIGFADH